MLYTLRSQNWNERLGRISTEDVKVLAGNHIPGPSHKELTNKTLKEVLENTTSYASYSGIKTKNFACEDKDKKATIRFQTVFLPIKEDEQCKKGKVEFLTETFNYRTYSNSEPQNMLILSTGQGLSFDQNIRGRQKIPFHTVNSDRKIERKWLEAERSEYKVGGEQIEDEKLMKEAEARGKTISREIGIPAMGKRLNVQMLIQVPLKPKIVREASIKCEEFDKAGKKKYKQYEDILCSSASSSQSMPPCPSVSSSLSKKTQCSRRSSCNMPAKNVSIGISNAARVSYGSTYDDDWQGIIKQDAERDPEQFISITVTFYYTILGGVPSIDDINHAIDDIDNLYQNCKEDKPLSQHVDVLKPLSKIFGFTNKNTNNINIKSESKGFSFKNLIKFWSSK
jgi:hypothetical protein